MVLYPKVNKRNVGYGTPPSIQFAGRDYRGYDTTEPDFRSIDINDGAYQE